MLTIECENRQKLHEFLSGNANVFFIKIDGIFAELTFTGELNAGNENLTLQKMEVIHPKTLASGGEIVPFTNNPDVVNHLQSGKNISVLEHSIKNTGSPHQKINVAQVNGSIANGSVSQLSIILSIASIVLDYWLVC
jgi:hypothetical protein